MLGPSPKAPRVASYCGNGQQHRAPKRPRPHPMEACTPDSGVSPDCPNWTPFAAGCQARSLPSRSARPTVAGGTDDRPMENIGRPTNLFGSISVQRLEEGCVCTPYPRRPMLFCMNLISCVVSGRFVLINNRVLRPTLIPATPPTRSTRWGLLPTAPHFVAVLGTPKLSAVARPPEWPQNLNKRAF